MILLPYYVLNNTIPYPILNLTLNLQIFTNNLGKICLISNPKRKTDPNPSFLGGKKLRFNKKYRNTSAIKWIKPTYWQFARQFLYPGRLLRSIINKGRYTYIVTIFGWQLSVAI